MIRHRSRRGDPDASFGIGGSTRSTALEMSGTPDTFRLALSGIPDSYWPTMLGMGMDLSPRMAEG